MKITKTHWLCFFLVFFRVEGSLHECGEFNQNGGVSRTVKTDSALMFLQNVLGDFFNAININNTRRITEVFDFVGNIIEEKVEKLFSSATQLKSVPDRIKAEGYPAEIHEVVTDDGYILQLHRIPYGKNSSSSDQPRPPVYLMHAFMESSNGWIVLGPENSLAFLLADSGYDVWLGNARGTVSSRRHKHLKPTGWRQKEYWSFSWHEIGYFDMPASIDYILNETKFEKLNYIGWSQGSISFFAMASMRPEYNEKIIEANLLAPVAALKGTRNPFYNSFAQYYKSIKSLPIYKIILNNDILLKVAETACKDAVDSTPKKCQLILTALNSNQINCTSLSSILVGTPDGASLKQGLHYLQLIRNGGFRQFDYESKRQNRKIYGSDTRPEYNLTQVTAPIIIDKFLSGHSKVSGKSNFSFGSARYLKDSIICGTISSVIKTYWKS